MTRKIAIALSKGGVGKTTTAINLAHGLARAGRRVMLIDTDTQGQVAGALGISPTLTLADFILSGNRQAITEARDNLFVLAGGVGINKIVQAIRDTEFMPHEYLTTSLTSLDQFFDYILVDTAPSWSEMAINVMAYADELLCPIPLEMLAVRGAQDFLRRAAPIIERTGGVVRYVLPTMQDRRLSQTAEIMAQLEAGFGERLCDPIRANVRLSEAPGHGQSIFEYAPTSRGAVDYKKLTQRILDDET